MMAAEIFLSAFIQVLFQSAVPLISENLELDSKLQQQLKILKNSLSLIQAFLKDAEERQRNEERVRVWLDQLKSIAYEANDLLDECATEVQRQQLIPLRTVRNSLSLVNPHRFMFNHGISRRLKEIVPKLDEIVKGGHAFNLISRNEEAKSVLDQTTSLPPSFIVGREANKMEVIQLLVSSSHETGLSVIPVLGMSGLGKTALVQFVYTDEAVANHFELKFWVHVSHDLNMNKVTKAMVESIDNLFLSPTNLDILQNHLCRKLNGRTYLLVLDGVCNVSPHEWERLRAPLLYGAKGSRILVTTTSQEVADVMGTSPPYRLQGLLDDDCWSLFCLHALGPNLHMSCDLDDIAKEVIDKCKGLPLVAKVIGFRLRKESDRSKWGGILRDEMWEFSGGDGLILCSFRFNYQHFPAHLKPCFAYCSIFPKGFLFNKEELVQLWMAQNFIQAGSTERIEDVGLQYFDSLLQSSFFQYSHFDYKRKRPKYTMADHIHQFAQSVVGESCIMEIGRPSNISETTRHCSLVHQPFASTNSRSRSSYGQKGTIERIYQCKSLYTLLIVSVAEPIGMDVPGLLAKNLSRLRALDLSNSGVSEVPESIGDLKHLRYLQLRNTNIKRLPNSVGELYNLQTLGLGNCYYLEELPKDTMYLRKLRHLDLRLDDDANSSRHPRAYSLRSMPPKIGELTDLQTLSRFVISREKRCGIGELQNLDNLYGELRISNLHLILNPTEAMDAKLNCKECLHQLELWWNDGISSSNPHSERVEEQVIQSLEPHPNLKELKIVGYKGASFPSWITGYSEFNHLVTLVLSDCSRTEVLPPLGHLPKLKDLHLEGMDGVMVVDCEFCGLKTRKFPALEKLHFERMRRLQVWCGDEGCMLPSLRELVIKDCVDLRQLTHKLPLLVKLEIDGSPRLIGLPRFQSLRSLNVKASGEWIWDSWPCITSLSSLTITQLPTRSLPSSLRGGNTSLCRLELSHCDQLISLPDDWLPVSLNYIGIRHCPQLCTLPDGMKHLNCLEELEIENCPLLLSLPGYRLPASLQFLSIENCPVLGQRCRDTQGEDWHKIVHITSVWIDKQQVASAFQSARC